MNPKILIAFLGGAALAGILALVLTSRAKDAPVVEGQATPTTSANVERPISPADVAATVEQVKPAPMEVAKRTMPLPKPAPVIVKKSSTAQPVKEAPATESAVTLPPFSKPVETARVEEPKRVEIMRPDPVVKPVQRMPETVTIPAGTTVSVRINSTLSSEKNTVGDTFTAVLDSPLVVNDIVLAERGAKVDGKVVEAAASGRVKGTAKLSVALTRIALSDGQRLELLTDPFVREAVSEKGKDAVKVGVIAGIGAAIGAIAGGGRGAAIGGASGAGAGTGVILATKGKPAQLDVETRIPFRIKEALTVTERIR